MNILNFLKTFILRHKIISAILLIVLIGGGFFAYNSLARTNVQTKYVLAKAEKGTIISSLSSSGSVSALSTIDIKAKASGDVVYVGAKAGQAVLAGQLLVKLDTTDAQVAIRTAQQNLESAQISLQKLEGDSTLAVPRNKQDAQDTLTRDYEAGYNSVANAFVDLPAIMVSLNDTLYGNTFNNYQSNMDYYAYVAYTYDEKSLQYSASADKSYKTAKSAYDKNFDDYKATSRFSDTGSIDSIISETYETTKTIAQAVKDANNLIQFYEDTLRAHSMTINNQADTHLSTLNSALSKVNSNLSTLLSAQSAIKSDKASLSDTGLDIQSQQLSLQKAQDAVAQAKRNLNDYYVYAPFDGIIAAMNAQVSDTAPGTIATIVTKKLTADISFGETDIAKIKLGQKATLTFDAVADLTITGQVSQIDTVGASSQGVVSYNVKILMDVQDDRIKPGMSTTAVVIIDTKTDALYVPNSAVKTQQGERYVLKVSDTVGNTEPTRQTVTVGVSDDSSTEITSGLKEGDVVVSSTVTSTIKTTTTTATGSSGVRIPGITGGAGNFGR